MSVEDLIDIDFDSLTEDNMDCEKSCVGSLPHTQRRYAEHAPLGLLTTQDEPPIDLFVKSKAERNQTFGMFGNQRTLLWLGQTLQYTKEYT